MAIWGSVRIPCFAAANCDIAQNGLIIDSLLSQSASLKAFTGVKRNPFPASLLKTKDAKAPSPSSAASRSCGVQIYDLIRRISNKTLSYTSPFRSHGGLQRTRSQRKEDWDMAMSWLMNGRDIPPKDEIHEARRAIQCPVLETIMQNYEESVSIILARESNMCFDMEFLKTVCKGLNCVRVYPQTFESNVSIGFLGAMKQGSSKKLVDPTPGHECIKGPIMTSTAIQKPHLLRRIIRESMESVFSVKDKFESEKDYTETRDNSNQIMNIMQLSDFENLRVSLPEQVQSAEKVLRRISKQGSDSDAVREDELLHLYLADGVDSKHAKLCVRNIHRPIFEHKLLMTGHGTNGSKVTFKELAARERHPNFCAADLFQSLSEFRRSPFTSERCLWSRASKDVMSRARYKRSRLLSSLTSTFSMILSSGHCPARSTAFSQVGANVEELDYHLISRLEPISTRLDGNKGRTTQLLDSLDFVAGRVAKRRREYLGACHQVVVATLHKFDPPTRKWSKIHFEKIRSRYEGYRQNLGKSNGRNDRRHSASEAIEVDSDESALEDFGLSDEDTEEQTIAANGFGVLEEIRADLRCHDQQKVKPDVPSRRVPKSVFHNGSKGSVCDIRNGIHKESKVRVKVPDALVCAPWVIQVAEQCVRTMPRGSLFIPPTLSALPIVAVLTNSHLKQDIRDQRVAIICESGTNVTDYIREYLQISLGESVSIDSIKRSEYDSVERIAPLPHTTARVIVLDSFSFSFSVSFSLLIVFVAKSTAYSAAHSRTDDQGFGLNASVWDRIPFVFLAPLGVGLQQSFAKIFCISQKLRAKDVLWVKAKDDVYDSILISTPRAIYLAPPQQVARVLFLLDVHAKSCMEAYFNLESNNTAEKTGNALGLQVVSLRLVKEAMQQTPYGDNIGRRQKLELLYVLRQARSFAVFDGFDVVVAYLRHCSRQPKRHLVGTMNSILEDLEDTADGTPRIKHPILKPLAKILREAENKMLQDPPSLHSIHRRDSFRPLIVANSQEAADGCLHGIQGAALLPDATDRNIAVCPVQYLQMETGKRRKVDLRKRLETFSHVFHIIDDRYDVASDFLLPPALLQLVHAGRTRLITVAVDETRELDGKWEFEKSRYLELTKELEKEEFGDIDYEAPYFQQTSVEAFWSAARYILPSSGREETETVHSSRPQGRFVKPPRAVDTPARTQSALLLTPSDICSHSVQSLRAKLTGDLQSLSNGCSLLEISFCVCPHESCSPAATYLHAAIAGSERLRKNVSVNTKFSF